MKLLEIFSLISGLIMVIASTENEGSGANKDSIDIVMEGYPIITKGEILISDEDEAARLRADSKIDELADSLEILLDRLQESVDEGFSEI